MRLHVLSLPHTITSKEYNSCAYTNKVLNFCKMMNDHEIFLYACEGSTANCSEMIEVVRRDELESFYGTDRNMFFSFNNDDEIYREFNKNAIRELTKRVQPYDFILCFFGNAHETIALAAKKKEPTCIIVEPGIGYPQGWFSENLVFESYALMHYVYGSKGDKVNKWSNTVIPAFFDPDDFEYKEDKEDYVLMLGRVIESKGIHIAIQATKLTKTKLFIAGPGNLKDLGYDEIPDHVTVMGHADVAMRKQLLANAKCLLLPTYYVEPFGCVTVEAMMSGTPVITTNWGAFTETVLHGLTGYRCSMIEQFIWAINNINLIDSKKCRDWAINNYSLHSVKDKYEEYFDMISKYSKVGYYYQYNARSDIKIPHVMFP